MGGDSHAYDIPNDSPRDKNAAVPKNYYVPSR